MDDQREAFEPESAMEASGMGLLPGMTLALVIGVAAIGASLLDTWWVVPLIALVLVALVVGVVAVVIAVIEEDDDDSRLRDYVPGI